MAAYLIAISLTSISFLVALEISQFADILVGNLVGEDNLIKVRNISFNLIFPGIIWMFFCGLIFFLFRSLLPNVYTNDERVIILDSKILIVAVLF